MVEILFSESAAASFKMAQNSSLKDVAVGVIITNKDGSKPSAEEIEQAQKKAEEQYRQELEKTVPLGGNYEDIYCFDLAWDMGDITEDGIGEKRLAVLNALYSIYDDDTQKGAKLQLEKAQENLRDVVQKLEKGEDVRVWYSDNPGEYCGMLWFMAELRKISGYIGKVYTVKMPEYVYNEENDTVTELRGWGEIGPSEWYDYIKLAQDKTREYWIYAQRWWNLVQENSVLRAVLNGRVHSVSEDIYDSYIWEEIDNMEEEFIQAYVIGAVLGKHQLGIGDAFVALRMEKFIESDILRVVPKTSRGPAVYHRKLRKNC